ncbi:poly(A) polymerase [Anaeromyxobacter dehalogenans 2CP-1]|uniref:Poly(A) polymerase I n=1 Tax=Anaeromyxobacter dehalogenans (strain ATCC BAA-258 / DSM 21875 / 2CP-1) TaxID=455488 RepID=B8J9V7_ANAD2|nr:polynucleotide adenylyltransferase PcnB [Anaeromyxobacter dehalogenans]ACL63660.1 poly(A) polymerase [Anaeromyxobacter dehalogenans 2CP-1]
MHEPSTKNDLFRPAYPAEDLEENRDRRPPPGLALDPPEAPPPEHPPEIPVDRLDGDALKVIARLRHMHHQAYLVGGCVRDLLLGATPKDFDVATDAHPGEVRAIFRNCRLIGRRFRLAHVYFRAGKVIEVATFRKNPTDVAEDVGEGEGDLLITRDNVFGTAEEDSVRRDFTVNGLFYDVATGEVIDYVGGRADLEAHRISTIGDPEIRMREDPVRALRAVRFAARLGFTIAPDTFEAMRRTSGELARCAPARVLEETFKLLRCGGSARAFELLRACGALPVILPALGAALETWDDGRRRAFFAHLAALDRLVRSGAEVSEAVLLGALLMHLGADAPRAGRADAARGDEDAGAPRWDEADAFLASLVQTARLPRKVAERIRLALHAQRQLEEPGKRRRRRGRGPAGQTYFQDALQLLEIRVRATGRGAEVLERWSAEAPHPHAPSERPGRAGPRDDRHERRDRREGSATHGADRDEGAVREVVIPTEAAEAADEADPEVREVDSSAAGEGGEGEASQGGRRRRRRRGGKRRRRRGAGASGPDGGAQVPPAEAGGQG